MKVLGSFNEHIDNGGISVKTYINDDNILCIESRTSYFGYPDITSVLKVRSHSSYKNGRKDKDILRDLGLMFLAAADKLTADDDVPGAK